MPYPAFPQAPQRNVNAQPPQPSGAVRTSTENVPFPSHFHAQRAGPHPSSSHLDSLHTTRTFVAPSHLSSQQDARQDVQYLNNPSGALQSQNQARQFASLHVTGVPIPAAQIPTRDMNPFSEAFPISAGTLHHTQRQSGAHSIRPISDTNTIRNVRPNHGVPNVDATYGGHGLVPPCQGTVNQMPQTFNHVPRSHHRPHVPGPHPAAVHNGQVALEDRTVSQNQILIHSGLPQSAVPPVPQRQPGINVTQGPPNGARGLHPDSHQSISPSNDAVCRAADRHATSILNATYSSLNVFYETQKSNLRDELLRMNAQNLRIKQQAEEACRRALRAEQVAKEKNKKLLCELANASCRKPWSGKSRWRTLEENMRLSNSKMQKQVAALRNRVTHLESRLRQYEDVPLSTEAKSPALRDNFDYVSGPSTWSAQGTPSPWETDDANASRSDVDKQRQQIVTELFEAHLKPKVPEDTDTTKEERPAVEGQERLSNASYVKDVAFDERNQCSTHNSALSGTSEATTVAASDGLPESAVDSLSTLRVDNQCPLPSGLISCAAPSSFASVNPLKRESRDEDDLVDQLRKRVRRSSTSPRRSLSGTAKETDKDTRTQEGTEIGATTPSSGTQGGDSGHGFSNGDRTENDDEMSLTQRESGMRPSHKSDSLLQIDAVHLQLIYHKLESGDKACRFCVMEIDHKVRSGEAMVFPATTQNDGLVAHAVTIHPSTVSRMLKMEKSEVLVAVARLMEVD